MQISKETLDLVTFVAGIFTIVAAIATLFALFIAWRMWKTWKIQQTYALHREKLIDNENNIIALYHYQSNVMKQMIEMAQIEFIRDLTEDEIERYTKILIRIYDKQVEFEDKYGFCLFTLERYGIKYPSSLRFDIVGFKKLTNDWIEKVRKCQSNEELNTVILDYFTESGNERDILLNRLSEFRHDSLK
ncbi:hypothetical protein [Acinetobacter seifertii]|uniref:hypothetical protein n=1 Tax=Acinetobacter seifertii TaxID=1530123 RepID=UPI0032160892